MKVSLQTNQMVIGRPIGVLATNGYSGATYVKITDDPELSIREKMTMSQSSRGLRRVSEF
jgi:hypothetical protein